MAHGPGFAGRAAVHARALEECILAPRAPKRHTLRQQAAIHFHGFPGDEARLVGHKERRHIGDDVDDLAAEVRDRRRLFKPGGISELKENGFVENHPRIGYYRPDAPPPELESTLKPKRHQKI